MCLSSIVQFNLCNKSWGKDLEWAAARLLVQQRHCEHMYIWHALRSHDLALPLEAKLAHQAEMGMNLLQLDILVQQRHCEQVHIWHALRFHDLALPLGSKLAH